MRRTVVMPLLGLLACSIVSPEQSAKKVYDITTKLDAFSFETPTPSPPDCPNTVSDYCTHERAFDGATLGGTITVTQDSVYGNLEGLFCSSWSLAGCSAVKAVAATDYPYADGTKVVPSIGPFSLRLGEASKPVIHMDATASGDSIYGNIRWSLYEYRSPPTHRGTFVAHLRH